MNSEALKAVIGIALVVGFIVIIILAVMADKKANEKFKKKIESTYQIKDRLKGIVITSDNSVLLYYPSGSLHGYKKWNLEDIAYVGFATVPANNKTFSFLGDDKKAMKGEYLTPSKKPLMQKTMAAFPLNGMSPDEIFGIIKKYKPDALRLTNGNVSED